MANSTPDFDLRASIRSIPDYPKPGIMFRDITTLLGDARDFPHEHEPCPIGSDRALDTALITAPEARDPALIAKLDAVAGRVLSTK